MIMREDEHFVDRGFLRGGGEGAHLI